MDDGLYLNGKWVAEVDCTLTFQGNDLLQPSVRTTSYSNTFQLPDTTLIRSLTANAEQVDAGGPNPYIQLSAQLIAEGEVIFSGVAEFVSFKGGWNVNLLDSLVTFFDGLGDKKLQDLDLSRLDHTWSLDSINSYAGATSGIVYPLIDYGGIQKNIVPYDTICPAVFVKTILEQAAREVGYTLVGEWLNDDLLKQGALPFVGSEPVAHDDDWVEDRKASVTSPDSSGFITLVDGSPIDVLLPLTADNLPLDGWTDGRMNCYIAERATYRCPGAMYVKVQASVLFYSITRIGAAELRLILERNGQPVYEEYWSEGGYYDSLDIPQTIHLDTEVSCAAGDELRIRLTGSARTSIADYEFLFSKASGDMWASFTPDPRIKLGDRWITATNLPADITCQDLFLSIAKMMSGTYEVNDKTRTVELVTFDSVVAKLAQAVNWSTRVEESQEPELQTKFDSYGQRNLCKWKEATEKENVGFGDGVIECNAKNLAIETTLFELPFAACINSTATISGYGNPILIKTRTIKGTGDNQTIDKVAALPRIILIEPTKTQEVTTTTLLDDGSLSNVNLTLTGCWWGIRPVGVSTATNGFTLAFSPLTGGREQTLIARYFGGLKRVLRRPRILSVSVYLTPADLATLHLSTPIRLKSVRAGSLDINDNSFFLNKLGPFKFGQTCMAVLIAIA